MYMNNLKYSKKIPKKPLINEQYPNFNNPLFKAIIKYIPP